MAKINSVFTPEQLAEAAVYANKRLFFFRHSNSLIFGKKIPDFVHHRLLMAVGRKETEKYLLFHILIGSTPDEEITYLYDFDGDLSIRLFIDGLLKELGLDYIPPTPKEETMNEADRARFQPELDRLLNEIDDGDWPDYDSIQEVIKQVAEADLKVMLEMSGLLELRTDEGLAFLKGQFKTE